MLVPGNSDLVLSERCPIVKSYNYSTLFLRIRASTWMNCKLFCTMYVAWMFSWLWFVKHWRRWDLLDKDWRVLLCGDRTKKEQSLWCRHSAYLRTVDESGSDHRDSRRKMGYGLRGIPPVSFQLRVRSTRISAVSCITTEDLYLTEGSVNSDAFMEFVQQCLLPVLKPFNGQNTKSIVLLDNASIHHVEKVQEAVNGVGALLWFLPPYSPDLNPIEECFSKIKKF